MKMVYRFGYYLNITDITVQIKLYKPWTPKVVMSQDNEQRNHKVTMQWNVTLSMCCWRKPLFANIIFVQ